MPNRSIIQTGEIYHIYNRGVEKRDVFCEQLDYIRFIHDLFEFNDTRPAPQFDRRYQPGDNVGRLPSNIRSGERLVEILAFCLMSNHYHILIRSIVGGGLPNFMLKLGTGYTNAFNGKNERVGSLFQGPYKAKHVDNEEYLRHLVAYIHLNPLKFCRVLDKNKKLDFDKTWNKLNKYRWSSHLDYLGEDNFGSVIEKKFILDLFGSVMGYKEFVHDWIKYESEKLDFISSVVIDLE